ncbi:MAG: ATP-binding cassette domain-containing protein [Candidatus Eisenbacteria bacterium]|nr:ATP-binding cassette domain-containing protein [Candidatus Latescibacterota bacterium]MBD3301871.1 ATP-binding cassette domain-containing protein [Candidatus Eisenbacteria bacterium]
MIALENVAKSFGGKRALEPTSLALPPQKTLALIGPSGCGKSTLLRLVIGLIAADSGRITIDETEMTPATARALRRRIGYVIQEGGLFPHLSAARNVSLMAEHLGWDRRRIRERIAALAELVGLDPAILDRTPHRLSGGQRQRIGVMRALMLDPELLLLDEPLGALDPVIRRRLQEDLRGIFRRLGKTVLLVTHDMGEASYLGDEIALMQAGRIVQRGTLADLLERPRDRFVTEFIRAQRPLWTTEATEDR